MPACRYRTSSRNIDEAIRPILEAFCWLGLGWDEGPQVDGEFGPYFQSQRSALYQEAVERLLQEGKAYRCYDLPEVIQADREFKVLGNNELDDGFMASPAITGQALILRTRSHLYRIENETGA